MPLDIENVKRRKQIRFTDHARIEMAEDDIYVSEVLKALESGKIIERYPADRPFPSCLLYGTANDKPIHIVCALPEHVNIVIIVTVYIPDPEKWVNFERRMR